MLIMNKETVRKGYIKVCLEDGKPSDSVYAFCKKLKMDEDSFYKLYNSLEMIDKDIWLGWFENTIATLNADETYNSYSAKEKLLAYYFTWVQNLRKNRSYVLMQKKNLDLKSIRNDQLSEFKKAFELYINSLLNQGMDENQIQERKFISDKYHYGFWLQLLFVLDYWIKDTSLDFEQTDAAIEKAVNLSFKLIGENALDSIIDFGKFLLQKK